MTPPESSLGIPTESRRASSSKLLLVVVMIGTCVTGLLCLKVLTVMNDETVRSAEFNSSKVFLGRKKWKPAELVVSVKKNVLAPGTTIESTSALLSQRNNTFRSEAQRNLWNLVANGTSIDMTPYLADNIPQKDRWWPDSFTEPPGTAGGGGRLVYHLHVPKCGGTTYCAYFRTARPDNEIGSGLDAFGRQAGWGITNPIDNCNVPRDWWVKESLRKAMVVHSKYSFMGNTREKMKEIYNKIRKKNWTMVGNEGALEPEPIFGGPYFHTIVLRDPTSWILSMWKYQRHDLNLDRYLQNHLRGGPNFFTRQLCGEDCPRGNEDLTTHHFLRAKSMLEKFDLIMILEKMESDSPLLFRTHFPTLTMELEHTRQNVANNNHRPANFTMWQKSFIHNYTWMDQVLYEYAKVLHQEKVDALM